MYLPTLGSGKVKIGSNVIIKLDNYPYEEFGSIKGKIKSISLLPKQKSVQDANSKTVSLNEYLVVIDLPQNLITNYGKQLKFQYDLKGNAELIANNRMLIQRLFDNLKYLTEK